MRELSMKRVYMHCLDIYGMYWECDHTVLALYMN